MDGIPSDGVGFSCFLMENVASPVPIYYSPANGTAAVIKLLCHRAGIGFSGFEV